MARLIPHPIRNALPLTLPVGCDLAAALRTRRARRFATMLMCLLSFTYSTKAPRGVRSLRSRSQVADSRRSIIAFLHPPFRSWPSLWYTVAVVNIWYGLVLWLSPFNIFPTYGKWKFACELTGRCNCQLVWGAHSHAHSIWA